MWKWIIGLAVSIMVGQVVTASSLVCLRRYLEERKDKDKQLSKNEKLLAYLGIDFYPPIAASERHVPGWIVGFAERLFFTLIIAFNISGAAIAMVGWITLKMVTSQPYRKKQGKERTKIVERKLVANSKEESEGISSTLPFEFAGLLGNLLSMFFALIGGLIILKL